MEQERNRYRESLLALHERERLGREMHDGLAQDLAALKLKIHRLRALWPGAEGSEIAGELRETQAIIEDCYGEVRQNLYDLRAGHHLSSGLWKTLAMQIDDFRDQTGLRVEWRIGLELEEPTDPRFAVQVLRIVQEALANIRKHAHATEVTIETRQFGDDLLLSVLDNGQGLIANKMSEGHHFGLLVMQERAQSVGANVSIATGPDGRGTVVEITWAASGGGEAHRKRKASVGG